MLTKDQRDEEVILSLLDLKKLHFPRTPRVVEIRHRLDADSFGEDAAQVYVILAEDSFGWSQVQPIYDAIWAAFEGASVERRPYIHFRSQAEQAALDAGTYFAEETAEAV